MARRSTSKPFTDWADVPLVASIEDVARVLNRSVSSINEDLRVGRMVPQPMPDLNPSKRRMRRQWSKAALQAYLDGGYQVFLESAARRRRQFFASARVNKSKWNFLE